MKASEKKAAQIGNVEAEIRARTEEWKAAVSEKNIDGIMRHYADDVRVFDVPPPLQVNGKASYRENWTNWLNMFDGPVTCEFEDQQIIAGEEIAIVHTLTRASEKKSGPESGSWVRVTVCFQKIGSDWLVTHEHVSVPFNGMTGRSVTDLKP